jgi:hypothetical protein
MFYFKRYFIFNAKKNHRWEIPCKDSPLILTRMCALWHLQSFFLKDEQSNWSIVCGRNECNDYPPVTLPKFKHHLLKKIHHLFFTRRRRMGPGVVEMTNYSRPDIRLSQTTNSEEITNNKLHTKQIWLYQYYNSNFTNTLLVFLIKIFYFKQ